MIARGFRLDKKLIAATHQKTNIHGADSPGSIWMNTVGGEVEMDVGGEIPSVVLELHLTSFEHSLETCIGVRWAAITRGLLGLALALLAGIGYQRCVGRLRDNGVLELGHFLGVKRITVSDLRLVINETHRIAVDYRTVELGLVVVAPQNSDPMVIHGTRD